MTAFVIFRCVNYRGHGELWVQWKNTGGLKQKHKKQPFGDASASRLSLVLRHVWFQAEAWISHTTSPTPPSYEVGGIAKRIKTARLRRKTNLQKSDYPKTLIKRDPNALCVVEYDNCVCIKWLYSMYYIDCRRMFNITALPKCWLSSWEIWCSFLPRNHCIIRGFSPWNGERFLSLGQSGQPS